MVPAIIWPKYLLKNYEKTRGRRNTQQEEIEETESVSERLSTAGSSDYDAFLVALKLNPSMLFNTKTVITFDVLHNMSILFTFGLCSPFLTLIISMAMILKMNMWLIFMGRFLNYFEFDDNEGLGRGRARSNTDRNAIDEGKISNHKGKIEVSKDNMHPALLALSTVCIPIEDVFYKSVWPITWTSAAFFAFLCWDLSADKVGWEQAIWIPCLALSFPVLLWIVTKLVERWGSKILFFYLDWTKHWRRGGINRDAGGVVSDSELGADDDDDSIELTSPAL
jgi:hypothetical protein